MSKTKSLGSLTLKGHREFRHDLFKLELAKCKKNRSWKHKQPMIYEVEHVHTYHSINDRTGNPNTMCTPIGGHSHEVEVIWDEAKENILSMTCGPPLVQVTRIVPGEGAVRRFEAIVYQTHEHSKVPDIVDEHTHEMTYLDTEMISQYKREAKRQDTQVKIMAAMDKSKPATQMVASQKIQESAEGAKSFTADN